MKLQLIIKEENNLFAKRILIHLKCIPGAVVVVPILGKVF